MKKILIMCIFLTILISLGVIPNKKEYQEQLENESVELAININGMESNNLPLKNEKIIFLNSKCFVNNNLDETVEITWDYETWSPIIKGLKEYPTKCSLFFKEITVTTPTIEINTSEWTYTSPIVKIITAGTSENQIDHYDYYITTDSNFVPDINTAPTGHTTNELSITQEGVSYIYYRAVDENGEVSFWSNKVIAKLDSSTPIITMLDGGTYNPTNNNKIATATYGISGGQLICINETAGNQVVSTIDSIKGIGNYTISCTASSLAGKEITKKSTYNLVGSIFNKCRFGDADFSTTHHYGNGIELLSNNFIQYGPYYKIIKGCYKITYKGTNLDQTCVYIDSYQNSPKIQYNILNLIKNNTSITYYINVGNSLLGSPNSGIEFHIANNCSKDIEISDIIVESVASCPS